MDPDHDWQMHRTIQSWGPYVQIQTILARGRHETGIPAHVGLGAGALILCRRAYSCQRATGIGSRHRSAPTGGAANGMPLKTAPEAPSCVSLQDTAAEPNDGAGTGSQRGAPTAHQERSSVQSACFTLFFLMGARTTDERESHGRIDRQNFVAPGGAYQRWVCSSQASKARAGTSCSMLRLSLAASAIFWNATKRCGGSSAASGNPR